MKKINYCFSTAALDTPSVDVLVGQDYSTMGSLGVELLYKLIMGEEVDLGDENNFIDTGYEIVDKSNYEEIWATKTPW